MGVLLMFNNSDSVTLEQIQEQTQLKMVGLFCLGGGGTIICKLYGYVLL